MEEILNFKDKVFLISDTHFYHKNIINYCNRPFKDVEEMNKVIISNWNSVVPKDGIVFHLGDFALCGASKFKEIMEQLNGEIHLIRGNHDALKSTIRDSFTSVEYQKVFNYKDKLIYLNHFPFIDVPKNAIQFHGHLHTGPTNPYTLQANQYDVGVDNNDYKPISLEKALEIVNKQLENESMCNK